MNSKSKRQKLTKNGIRYVIVMLFFVILQAALIFIAAGKLALPRVWAFIGIHLLCSIIVLWIQIRRLPDLLNHRGEFKSDAKTWDQILMRVHNLILLLVMPVVIGLDVGRFAEAKLPWAYIIPGFLLYMISQILVNWAMFTNPHFEATVRIQTDREHHVIRSGPYKFIRHPGYTAGIFYALGVPLIVGSAWALIPGGIAIALLVLRTYLEDTTLQKELSGYSDYAQSVKFRLLPLIW